MDKFMIFNKYTGTPTQIIPSVTSFEVSFRNVHLNTHDGENPEFLGITHPFIFVTMETLDEDVTFSDSLNFMKKLKLDELKKVNETDIERGFEYEGDFFSFSKDKDQSNFGQKTSIIGFKKTMGYDTTSNLIEWKTENNGVKVFTEEEFFNICLASEKHKENHIRRFWDFATTVTTTEYEKFDEIENLELPPMNVTVEKATL